MSFARRCWIIQDQCHNLNFRSFGPCRCNFGVWKYLAAFSTFNRGQKELRDLLQYLITLFIHSRLQFPLAQIAASYVPVSSKSNQSGLRNCPWVGVGRSPSFSQNVSNSSNSKCWHRPNLDVDIIQGARHQPWPNIDSNETPKSWQLNVGIKQIQTQPTSQK